MNMYTYIHKYTYICIYIYIYIHYSYIYIYIYIYANFHSTRIARIAWAYSIHMQPAETSIQLIQPSPEWLHQIFDHPI